MSEDVLMTRWRVHHKAETASTNADAKSGRAWDVFTADFQTAGRGRLDHRWLSAPGKNLVMSAVLPVEGLPPDHVATLPLAVGLAVAEALGRICRAGGVDVEVALKWPNDVLVGGRKICGVLCERSGDCVIAGVGVNVGETDFPEEIAWRATSLAALGVEANVRDVLSAVLKSLGSVFDEWKGGGFAAIWPRIAGMDALKGRWLEVVQTDADKAPASGVCGGIQSDGSLLVGATAIWSGEARILMPI